ncbi:MAG: hypothetical protein ACRD22_15850 [Terriglobia bacterium]
MEDKQFLDKFKPFACEGDIIQTNPINGIIYFARLTRDEDALNPAQHEEGFWPSMDPENTGYRGHADPGRHAREMAQARKIKEEWEAGNWWYAGIVIRAQANRVVLNDLASCWGLDVNYPVPEDDDGAGEDVRNSHLNECAEEVLGQAQIEAEGRVLEMAKLVPRIKREKRRREKEKAIWTKQISYPIERGARK